MICSKCGKSSLECECENFHPNIPEVTPIRDGLVKILIKIVELEAEVGHLIERLNLEINGR